MEIQITPAILSTSIEDFKNDLSKLSGVESLNGGVLHIDFMDGEFVPNKSITLDDLNDIEVPFSMEAHLMVNHPIDWVDSVIENKFTKIIFHIECQDPIRDTILKIKNSGVKIGLAINPETPIESVEQHLKEVDEVLIMSITPGFQGQPFIEETLDRLGAIKQLREKSELSFQIGVDGHVTDETAPKIISAGADILVVGSFLLKGNPDEQIEKLWEVIKT